MMKRTRFLGLVSLCCLCTSPATAEQDHVEVDVTGGKVAVSDWIVEQPLDLVAAARLLGRTGPFQAANVRVIEVDVAGKALGPVPFQLDREEATGEFVVIWQMPGEIKSSQPRHFLIALDGRGGGAVIDVPLQTTGDDNHVKIVNGPIILEHGRDAGGMIHRVTVGGTSGELSWRDQLSTVSPGRPHRCDNHAAERMRVVRKLLHCHHHFGRPYLAYGEMLRLPPSASSQRDHGGASIP